MDEDWTIHYRAIFLLSYSGGHSEKIKNKKLKTRKKITRSQHMLKHIITMLMGQVNT